MKSKIIAVLSGIRDFLANLVFELILGVLALVHFGVLAWVIDKHSEETEERIELCRSNGYETIASSHTEYFCYGNKPTKRIILKHNTNAYVLE